LSLSFKSSMIYRPTPGEGGANTLSITPQIRLGKSKVYLNITFYKNGFNSLNIRTTTRFILF